MINKQSEESTDINYRASWDTAFIARHHNYQYCVWLERRAIACCSGPKSDNPEAALLMEFRRGNQ